MRREYVNEQRERFGRRSLAILPVHYPKELLTALDVHAVELWGPPGPPRGPGAGRLQSYVCAVARNALAFLESGGADAVDGILFPHTCDTLQGLATLVTDLGGWGKAAFVFQHARGADRPSARRFLEAELRALARALEGWTGRTLSPERLAWALALHREVDRHRAALLASRASIPSSDPDLYALLRRGEWLWPEEHLDELLSLFAKRGAGTAPHGLPILVTGYVPEPPGLLAALHEAGLLITADDYAAVGRRVARESAADEPADPWEALVARHLARPPCPTRGGDQDARMRHLVSLAEGCGARGVLVHVQKFCEPELFDVPAIRAAFAARGLPCLVLEGELESELPAQAVTRLEAFAEMLRGRAA